MFGSQILENSNEHPIVIDFILNHNTLLLSDSVILMNIFISRIIGDFNTDHQIQIRNDVNIRKVLRAFKAFYETKV